MPQNYTPNFFIIGAAKSGSTSLYSYLGKHKEVYFSPIKEPNYFCTDIIPDNFCNSYKKRTTFVNSSYFEKKPLQELQLSFIRNKDWYKQLFDAVTTEKAIGESSTTYLLSETAAQNIYAYQPNAKIIVLLRNPILRAYSHYLMALRYGFTSLSFYDALQKDRNAKNKGFGISEMFIETGMYYEQLKRYFSVFPEKQIHVILFKDLVNNTLETVNKCALFLDISPLKSLNTEIKNAAEVPRNAYINKLMSDIRIKQLGANIFSDKLKTKLKKILVSNQYNKISQSDFDFLLSIYKTNIEQTSQLLNKDLSYWLTKD